MSSWETSRKYLVDATPTNSARRIPSRRFTTTSVDSQVASPGLDTFRRADASLRAELGILASSPWDEDGDVFGTPLSPNNGRTTRIASTPQTYSTPDGTGFNEDMFADQLKSLDLSPTNRKRPSMLHASRSHPLPTSRSTQVIRETKPQGIGGTHLPWVKQISPNRFTQSVDLQSSPPETKSFWDAEDDEFDRWPSAQQAQEALKTVRTKATSKRNAFFHATNRVADAKRSIAEMIADAVDTPMGDDDSNGEDDKEQVILELEDMNCGNPWGRDKHDEILEQFRSKAYANLPADAPARIMHVLDAEAYVASIDPVIKAARPRLCDAVATILAYTSVECQQAFLNPDVKVFEWRRSGDCVMIRREGNEVVAGNYYNFGTQYQWGFLVKSVIDDDGAWSEVYASVSQGTTPVTKEGVRFEEFVAEYDNGDFEPTNEEFALYVGRELANFLLRWSVWDYGKWWKYKVEWEADGVLVDARGRNRYPVGLLQELQK